MGLLYGENCMILASTVFDWSTRVSDGQTDGIAMAYTRYSIYAVARKKNLTVSDTRPRYLKSLEPDFWISS